MDRKTITMNPIGTIYSPYKQFKDMPYKTIATVDLRKVQVAAFLLTFTLQWQLKLPGKPL